MRTRRQVYVQFLAAFAVLGALGLGASLYVLAKQRVALPFERFGTLSVEVAEADGVLAGVGQPVNVAGVKVGQITGVELVDGRAVIRLRLDREQVPEVRANATVALQPITPLKDMQLDLDPGRPPARVLADGARLGVDRSSVPVPLADLLSRLDADTRTYLTGLIASVAGGTRERGPDLRRMLLALGPATESAGRVSRALEARRRALARLVTNLGKVTSAASRDRRLAEVVTSGNAVLASLASQDQALRATLDELPPTLAQTRATLRAATPLADELGPTAAALEPPVRRLPGALERLRPFVRQTTTALRADIRPLVRAARPLLRDAAPAVVSLRSAAPPLTDAVAALTYFFNTLAYNPPGPEEEGMLFWLAWGFHNLNSLASTADAHGAIARATRVVDCAGLQDMEQLQDAMGVLGACPE